MSTPDSVRAMAADKRGAWTSWIGWTIVLVLLAYFILKNVPRYFVFTPKSYGSYFWPRVSWLFPHVASGLLAALIGPVQFWPRMRRDYLQAHRIAGRVYVVTVVIGAIAAWGMALNIEGGPVYALGLSALALAWVTTTLMAFVAIRRKHVLQHQQWMVRSYVVTFAFVTFRLCDDAMSALHLMDDNTRSMFLAWACWSVPLLVTEVVLQSGKVFRGTARD